MIKGQWQESDSPLRVRLRSMEASLDAASARRSAGVPSLPADRRKALAELPPVFSQKALLEHVSFLADPARQGRGPGSEGHEAAAKYIAERFKAFGLAPGGDDNSYFQPLTMAVGTGGEEKRGGERHWLHSRHEGGLEGAGGRGRRALRSPRPRLARRSQGRRGQGAPRRGRQRERCRGDARTGARAVRLREAVARDRLRGLHGRGRGPARVEVLRRAREAVPRREDDRRHQPRHRRPAGRSEVVGARHRDSDRVAAHLPRGGLRDRRREPERAGVAAGIRPGELREEGRAGRADLHERARRLSPPERYRRTRSTHRAS